MTQNDALTHSVLLHCLALAMLLVLGEFAIPETIRTHNRAYVELVLGNAPRTIVTEPQRLKPIPVVPARRVIATTRRPFIPATQAGVYSKPVTPQAVAPVVTKSTFSELDGRACRVFYKGEAISNTEREKAVGMWREALSLMQEAVPLLKQELGKEENAVLAMAVRNTGRCYERLGDYQKAESLFRESAEMYQRISGTESAERAISLVYLGDLFLTEGKLDAAEKQFLESLPIYEKSYGEKADAVLWTHQRLLNLYRKMGRTVDANRESEIVQKLSLKQ